MTSFFKMVMNRGELLSYRESRQRRHAFKFVIIVRTRWREVLAAAAAACRHRRAAGRRLSGILRRPYLGDHGTVGAWLRVLFMAPWEGMAGEGRDAVFVVKRCRRSWEDETKEGEKDLKFRDDWNRFYFLIRHYKHNACAEKQTAQRKGDEFC